MVMVHISRHAVKIHSTATPPDATRSRTATNGANRKSIMTAAASVLDRGLHLFQPLGEQAGALLVEDLDDRARARLQRRVDEQERDGDAEAEHRRDHGLADALRHQLG